MDAAEKLFRKISKRNREMLVSVVERLLAGDTTLRVEKAKGTDLYKLRKGRFRIIFHYTSSGNIEVDSIRLRNEKTYKKL